MTPEHFHRFAEGGPCKECGWTRAEALEIEKARAAGISREEHFAGMAMLGMICASDLVYPAETIPKNAYIYANALIREKIQREAR